MNGDLLRRLRPRLLLAAAPLLLAPGALASGGTPASGSAFPLPLESYAGEEGMGLWALLVHRVQEDPINLVATAIRFVGLR